MTATRGALEEVGMVHDTGEATARTGRVMGYGDSHGIWQLLYMAIGRLSAESSESEAVVRLRREMEGASDEHLRAMLQIGTVAKRIMEDRAAANGARALREEKAAAKRAAYDAGRADRVASAPTRDGTTVECFGRTYAVETTDDDDVPYVLVGPKGGRCRLLRSIRNPQELYSLDGQMQKYALRFREVDGALIEVTRAS